MVCPNCSTEIPDSADTCPICETDVSAEKMTISDILTQNIMTENETSAKEKSNKKTGNIVGIIAAVLIVIAIAAGTILSSKDKYDGIYDYKLDDELAESLNQLDMTPQDLGIELYLEIKGDTFKMVTKTNEMNDVTSGNIKFTGTNITFYDDSNQLYGTYDKEEESITIDFSTMDSEGSTMVFVKRK